MSDQYSTTNTKPIDEPKEDPDPDGGLSDAERALIVSIHPASQHFMSRHLPTRADQICHQQEKKLLRRLDLKLIPWVCLLFCALSETQVTIIADGQKSYVSSISWPFWIEPTSAMRRLPD